MTRPARGAPTAGRPDLARIVGAFPGGPTRREVLDWALFHGHKQWERFVHRWSGRSRTPPHRALLTRAVAEVLRVFPDPVCIETGCIRNPREETGSTLAISSSLERGRLYTFDLEPRHLEVCREICREYDHRIEYVQGDAKEMLRRLRESRSVDAVHLAFFDSANDADQIWGEFRAIEDLFVPGSVVIVDDSVPPSNKGRRIKPYLHGHPSWETWLVYAGRGVLVALRREGGRRQL